MNFHPPARGLDHVGATWCHRSFSLTGGAPTSGHVAKAPRQSGRTLPNQALAGEGSKVMATPFIQYRRPVGAGPSGNT